MYLVTTSITAPIVSIRACRQQGVGLAGADRALQKRNGIPVKVTSARRVLLFETTHLYIISLIDLIQLHDLSIHPQFHKECLHLS